MAPDIRPLTPGRIPDLATLFAQGGDPRWCWCSYFRVRGRDWTNATAEQNRTVLEADAERTAGEGRAPGLLAYADDQVVGWVSVGPREDYERLRYSTLLAPVDDTPVWSIVCFVVGRRARGRGIARMLLDAAIVDARKHGATTLEAYPVEIEPGTRIAASSAYRGPLAMFEAAGFTVVARRQWNATSPSRPIVRLAL